MNATELSINGLFRKENGEIWVMTSHCLTPTCTMVNPFTGKIEGFGMGGLMAAEYSPVSGTDPYLRRQIAALAQNHYKNRSTRVERMQDSGGINDGT